MRVLAVSPHLDDVAFSCGGLLAAAVAAGDDVRVVTVFTRSVAPPIGEFALSTQLDKGLGADVDYLALRRAEDEAAMRCLGVESFAHLDLPEAPHRGYVSAADLFAGVHADDDITGGIRELLEPYVDGADLVLGPQALGSHVDHLHVARALVGLATATYRDTPYALRIAEPAVPSAGWVERAAPLDDASIAAKLDACAAYATQLGFQFGGPLRMRAALTDFAAAEARRLGVDGLAEAVTEPD